MSRTKFLWVTLDCALRLFLDDSCAPLNVQAIILVPSARLLANRYPIKFTIANSDSKLTPQLAGSPVWQEFYFFVAALSFLEASLSGDGSTSSGCADAMGTRTDGQEPSGHPEV